METIAIFKLKWNLKDSPLTLVLYKVHLFGNDFPKEIQNSSRNFLESSLLNIYKKYAIVIPSIITSNFLKLNLWPSELSNNIMVEICKNTPITKAFR